MKVIEVPKVTKKCWSDGAWTLAYIYSESGNFMLKGYYGDVSNYVDKLEVKWFGFFDLHYNGKKRTIISCGNDRVYIYKPNLRKDLGFGKKYHYIIRNNGVEYKLKRLPKKYIPEIFG